MSRNSRRSRDARLRMTLYSDQGGEPAAKADGPLRRGVYLLPATITSIGLLSGFYSMVASVSGHFEVGAVMIVIAFVCDGLDGRVARASRTSSQFGVEYDSLSDVVAFGVAPAMLAYSWALKPIGSFGIGVTGLFVICAALRLARFNVQTATADKSRFVGLPVPGAAAMMAGHGPRLQLLRTRFAANPLRDHGADHARARRPDDLARALSRASKPSSSKSARRSNS